MDRSFSIPKSMKRCSSMSQIDFVSAEGNSRKSSRESSKHKITPKVYRGRLSLGKPTGSAAKINRRKSINRNRFMDDDDIDFVLMDDLTVSRSPSSSAFRCLPVIGRESASSCSSEGRKSSESRQSGLIANQCSGDERRSLFDDMHGFLQADRSAKSTKLVVNARIAGEHYQKNFTIGNRKEKHKYGDVLWLILKAFFSGKEVSCGQDATFEEDSLVCSKRDALWHNVLKIIQFEALFFTAKSKCLEPAYMTHMADVRKTVHILLEDLDRFSSLFPTRRSMLDYITERKGVEFTARLTERMDVLTAWLNTIDDLEEKLRVLGEVFEVSRLPNAHTVWPRSMLQSTSILCLRHARPVFKAYVGRSLNLKGMKKVLARVWDICETSIVKAALLLHRPPISYAQAASGSRPHIPLNEDMKLRYDSDGPPTSRYGPSNLEFRAMKLPTFFPLFYFVLGVRMELLLEWLIIRAESTLPSDSDVDTLTLETMIEDSRDCVEEAVRAKRHFVSVIQATSSENKQYSDEFDTRLAQVFKKYLWYVSCWCRCVSSRADLSRLFSRLEKEWSSAILVARSIHSGIDDVTTTFASLVPHLLDRLVVEYWENSTESITEEHSINDIRIADEDELDYESPRDLFTACREHNRLIREVKDRSARIFALLRGALADLHDAVGYSYVDADFYHEQFLDRLQQDHCLVDIKDNQNMLRVTLLVDVKSADCARVEELLCHLSEGRPFKQSTGHIIVFPDRSLRSSWRGRVLPINVDDETLVCLQYLRRDVVLVIGEYSLDKTFPSVFEVAMPCCSSNEIIDDQLKELTRSLVEHSGRIWSMIQNMSTVFEHECVVDRIRGQINSTLLHSFTLAFQLHRDVFRLVSDSYRSLFGEELVVRSVEILERWKELVVLMKPTPSPHIPLWASHAFNFIYFVSEPKWTSFLTGDQFDAFVSCVSECKQLIVTSDPVSNIQSPIASHSHQTTRVRQPGFIHEKRREQLQRAAQKTDMDVANRQVYSIGKVVMTKPEKFTLSIVSHPTKEPPFTWQILEKIGSGSFADVYKALNDKEKCVIAVKKIKVDKSVLTIVEKEIDIFRNLQHANLVKYFGFQIVQDEVHILMEYCAEGTLERICREGLDMTLVRMYTNSLLLAISYLHANMVVHRDIKPANIFLDLRCRLKLGDFGCSVRLREADTVRGELAEYAGTPQYMAPEIQTYGGQLEDGGYRGYGRAVDIWSLGCVVLQMVTGRRPWPDMHHYQITMKVCSGEKPPCPSTAPAILKNFLDSCLEHDPDKRKSAENLLLDAFANIHVDIETVYSPSSEFHSSFKT